MKKILSVLIAFTMILSLALPCFADDDELATADEIAETTNKIQIIGIIVIAAVVVFLLIKNRNLFTKKSSSSSTLDEDKVSDEIRLTDESFKRDEFKHFAGQTITAILEAISSRSVHVLRLYETDEQFKEHEKQIHGYAESKQTQHYDDLKLISVELAEYSKKEKDEYLTVRASYSMLDYILADNGEVVEGSRLAKRTRPYKVTFVRSDEHDWLVSSITKWGHVS